MAKTKSTVVKEADGGKHRGVGKYPRLNRVETSRLVMYLGQMQGRIEEERISAGLATQMARDALGLEVGDFTVRAIGKELGIRWATAWEGRKVLARLDQSALLVLVGAVTDLYIVLGHKMPTGLEDLKTRLTEEMRGIVADSKDMRTADDM